MNTMPYQFQVKGARGIARFGGRCLLADEPGLGKAQPLSSKLLTPDGWVRMGDIRVGDKIIGSDGRAHNVTGVYPQGLKQVFKVTLKDKVTVRCCDDHLWNVRDGNARFRKSAYRTMPLKEIRKNMTCGDGRSKWHLPMIAPVEFPRKELPLNPYLLGYLIANGGLTSNTPSITIPDRETARRLGETVPRGTSLKQTQSSEITYTVSKDGGGSKTNPLTAILREMGLMGKGFAEKSIPHDYLYTSYTDRLALFQGLMDGDGSTSGEGIVLEYSTGSQQLAEQVVELVQSFGGMARLSSRIPFFKYKGERKQGAVSFRINISLPPACPPFQLSRKANAYRPRTKYPPERLIRAVEADGFEKCQCISVDSPDHLYATDGYVLTHNTVQSLLYLHRHPHIRPVVVVCPASLKWNWEHEAKVHFSWRAEVVDGMRPGQEWVHKPSMIIVNYDILSPSRNAPGWLHRLKSLKPQCVILDECQALQNRSAKRTKAVKELCKGVPHVIALSGTPLTNRPAEMFPVLNLLRPDVWPDWGTFARDHCDPQWKPWGWSFQGATNIKQLNEKLLQHVMIRRLKKDVLKDLPAKSNHILPLPLSDERQYAQAHRDFLLWLANHKPEKLSRASRAERLVQVGYLKRLAGELKVPAVCDWIDTFLSGGREKLVVFCSHRAVIERLEERYKKLCVVIEGETSARDRKLAVQKFQNAPSTRLFVGNTRAAGTGLTLTASSTVLFAELDWTPGAHSQASDRVNRIGQDSHCPIYYAIGKGTIEERLVQLLNRKQGVLDATLDGGESEDTGVFEELINELYRGNA